MYAAGLDAELSIAFGKKDEVSSVTAGGKYAKTVTKLYETLPADSANIRNILLTGYSSYAGTMCSDTLSEAVKIEAMRGWMDLQERVSELVLSTRAVNESLDAALSDTSSDAWSEVDGAVERFAEARSML